MSPTTDPVTPFVEGNIGFANLSFDVDAEAAGIDISDEIEDLADVDSETEFLFLLGGGVALNATPVLGIDIGYRYNRIFTDDPAISLSAIYAAARFRF